MKSIEERRAIRETPIPEAPPLKKCDGACGCYIEVARAGELFDVDRKNKDGFKSTCRNCRRDMRLVKKAAQREKRAGRIDKMMQKLLGHAQFGGVTDVAHIAEIFSKITALFGGANGIAMAFTHTYLHANPGSSVRQRMLGQYLTLANAVTETGAAKVPDELLSPEELDARVQQLAKAAGRRKTLRMHQPDPVDDGDSTEGLDNA